MRYIHYWHFANQWYMYIDGDPNHGEILSGNECEYYAYYWKEDYLIRDSIGLTHRQIKEKLTEQYPNYILIKEIAYHEGARWNGYKKGSRNK